MARRRLKVRAALRPWAKTVRLSTTISAQSHQPSDKAAKVTLQRRAFLTTAASMAAVGPALGAPKLIEGFSPDRLQRIRPWLEKGVADHRMAGGVWRIMRHGRLVDQGAFGLSDVASNRAMTLDAMFRIFSMTKPVTVATAMSLYEEAKFDLHDPVSKWIPQFRTMQVQTEVQDASGVKSLHLAPPSRPVMVLDLMRHTAGLSYAGPKDDQGRSQYSLLGVDRPDAPLSEWIKRITAAPLVRDPGTGFDYGYGMDVLGRLIEIWADAPFDQVMRERVLAPLGMKDTGFWVSPDKASRVATLYSPSSLGDRLPDGSIDVGGAIIRSPFAAQDAWRKEPALKYGGAGLISTAADYSRFLEMLRGDGALDGVRVLAPSTVALMHSDLLGSIPAKLSDIWGGYGFGLAMEVDRGLEQAATPLAPGSYDWGGAASTWMWVDPKNELTGMLLLQVFPSAPRWGQLFKQLVYGALVAPQ